jgi:hypothetical protein
MGCGDCWVFNNAIVIGNAEVSGNAMVSGITEVSGNVYFNGPVPVVEDARVAEKSMKKKFKLTDNPVEHFYPIEDGIACGEAEVVKELLTPTPVASNAKLDFTLAPVEFDDVVKVLQHLASTGKYEANGWLEGKDFEMEKNLASIRRHINEYRRGLREDADSKLHPLLHVAYRALMQYTLDARKKE